MTRNPAKLIPEGFSPVPSLDAYGLETRDPFALVLEHVARHESAPTLDWATTRQVLKMRDGRAHRVDVYSTQ